MSSKKKNTARERRQEKRRKEQARSNLIWIAAGGIVVVLVGFLIWNSVFRAPIGEKIAATGSGVHLANGAPLPSYSSNPPTSGPHYATTLGSGFYDQDDPMTAPFQNAPGLIIHSMEHGFVVLWYNCSLMSETDCADLKANISGKIDQEKSYKIIGFPLTTIAKPLALTSWGYLLELDGWDEGQVDEFISRNRNNAPEATAPNEMKN